MIGFAILGCGRIGRVHARNLACHPRAKLIGLHDVVAQAAACLAHELGVRAVPDAGTLLADPAVDAVLIATPTDSHVALITAAAKAGKAVLCEKPIDLDIARATACWADIRSLDPLVMIGFNRRFDPSFRALRGRILAGEIGPVEQVVITSRDPSPPPLDYIGRSGGLFRDMTIHDFDMARYLVGEIVEVQALGANLVDPAIKDAGDVDAAMVLMRAASGALVHINNSRRASYGYDQRIEVFGARGMLLAGNQRATTVEGWSAAGTQTRDTVLDFFIERYAAAYADEIDHFVTCVMDGGTPLAGFADGVAALRLADAALESAATGRAIRLADAPSGDGAR